MMNRRFFSLFLAGVVFASVSAATSGAVFADDIYDTDLDDEEETIYTSEDGNYTYTRTDDDTVSIFRYKSDDTADLVIPSEIDGYTVTELLGGAIVNHTELTSITLPATLEKLDDSCFFGCTSLETFYVEDGNDSFTVDDNILYTGDMTRLICYPSGNDAETFTIPGGVVEIWSSAFACAPLTSVSFPEGLVYIDDWAFSYVPLKSLSLPDSVIEISDDAFIYCTGLTEVTFPSSLETIGAEAFAACENLETITLNDGLTSVGQSAFAGTAMTEVTIPSSVSTISFAAFGYEADTVTPVSGFVVYGESGSQAQAYCTDSDDENDYENNFTFRSVMSETVEDAETEVVVTQEKEDSFFDQYGTLVFIICVIVVLIAAALILILTGRGKKEDTPAPKATEPEDPMKDLSSIPPEDFSDGGGNDAGDD